MNLSPQFWSLWVAMSRRLGAHPEDLASVVFCESGFNPAAHNPMGNASGLNQLMPANLAGVGFSGDHNAFRMLSAIEQLPYVEKYFYPFRKFLIDAVSCYVINFMPGTAASVMAATAQGKDYTFGAKDGSEFSRMIYRYNPGLDRDHDGDIQLSDLRNWLTAQLVGPKWKEVTDGIAQALTGPIVAPKFVKAVVSVKDVQVALNLLGSELVTDGWWGPLTKAEVVSFQQRSGLVVDGIAGPKTRTALELAVSGLP